MTIQAIDPMAIQAVDPITIQAMGPITIQTIDPMEEKMPSQLTHLFKCWLMSRWDDWTFNTLGVSQPLWSVGQQCRCCCRTPACWRYSTILLTYNTYSLRRRVSFQCGLPADSASHRPDDNTGQRLDHNTSPRPDSNTGQRPIDNTSHRQTKQIWVASCISDVFCIFRPSHRAVARATAKQSPVAGEGNG